MFSLLSLAFFVHSYLRSCVLTLPWTGEEEMEEGKLEADAIRLFLFTLGLEETCGKEVV